MPLSGTAYCAVADVTQALTSLNAQGTPADMPTAVVQLAIEQASSRVSAWTGQVWGFNGAGQVIAVPDIIISTTIDIACYYATLSYRKNKPVEANDPVVMRYNDAMVDLKAIQEGEISVNPVPPNEPFQRTGTVINTVPKTLTMEDAGVRLERGRVRVQDYPDGLPGQPSF